MPKIPIVIIDGLPAGGNSFADVVETGVGIITWVGEGVDVR